MDMGTALVKVTMILSVTWLITLVFCTLCGWIFNR